MSLLEDYQTDVPDEVPKDIGVSKIKFSRKPTDEQVTPENIGSVVFKFLKNHVTSDNANNGNVIFKVPYSVRDDSGKSFFIVECYVKSKKSRAGSIDSNHGQLCFVYWGTDANEVIIYCLINSAYSGAWSRLRKIRDCYFPHKFAKTFLNSRNIRTASVNYLSGLCTNSQNLTFSENSFQSSKIMDNYGIVEKFSATVNIATEHGKELVAELNSIKNPIQVQTGQVKLPLIVSKNKTISPSSHLKLCETIHRNVFDKTLLDGDWKFLDYVIPVFGNPKLDESLLKDMHEYLMDKSKANQLVFNPSSNLTYVYQDSFDNSQQVELLYGEETISFFGKGLSVTIEDIFDRLRCLNIRNKKDLKRVKLKFFNEVEGGPVAEPLVNMIHSQGTIQTDGMYSAFRYRGRWYKVHIDNHHMITLRFIDAVKECFMKDLPEILEWCYKPMEKGSPMFTIDDLYHFCMTNGTDEIDEEYEKGEKNKLKLILSNNTQILEENKNAHDQQITYINHLVGNKKHLASIIDSSRTKMQHSVDLLALNTCIITDSPIEKMIAKLLSPDREMLSTEESFHIAKEKKNIKLIEELKRSSPIIKPTSRDATSFFVEKPYLTQNVLEEIERAGINICPVKLVQFLRMCTSHLSEGDYNELYHLSNCECNKTDFIYVVGDRIFSQKNHKVELFDVMALNLKSKEAYLLHVKSKFDASSARAMCSQVSMCGSELWNSLTANSEESMLHKFYEVATELPENASLHRRLTRSEIGKFACNVDHFLEIMMTKGIQFYVCAAPCLSRDCFANLLHAQIDYKFHDDNFKAYGLPILDDLEKVGMIDKIKKTVTPKFLSTKENFVNIVREYIPKKYASMVYDYVKDVISGGHKTSLLDNVSSFVAKYEMVELHKKFINYSVHGNRQIQLRIVEIQPLEDRFIFNKKLSFSKTSNLKRKAVIVKEENDYEPLTKNSKMGQLF